MANQWFRMYAEFASDPKVQMLSETDQRRFIMLLCMRCSNDDETFHDDHIVFQLRVSSEEWGKTKALFLDKKLIDENNQPIAWDKRQYCSDSSTDRVRKHRATTKKQDGNVSVTPPEQNRTEHIRTEQSDSVSGNEKKSFVFKPTDDTHEQILLLAPGWDRQALYNKFTDWVQTNAKEIPISPQKAFLGWVPKFTANKDRKHYSA